MPDPFTPGAPANGRRETQAPAAAQAGPQVHLTPPATALGAQDKEQPKESPRPLMELREVSVFYGDFEAVRDTNLPIGQNRITAMIGPRMDQVVVLLIGLPPTTPKPCSANSRPKRATTTPSTMTMTRPIPRH